MTNERMPRHPSRDLGGYNTDNNIDTSFWRHQLKYSDVVWKLLVMDNNNSTIFSELLNEPLNEHKLNNNSPTAALGVEAMNIGTETVHNEPLNEPLNELLNELLYEKQKPNNSPTTVLGVEAMDIGTETVHKELLNEPLNEPLKEQQKPNNSPTVALGVEAMNIGTETVHKDPQPRKQKLSKKSTHKEKYFTEKKLKEKSTPRAKLKEKYLTEKKRKEKPKKSVNATTPVIDANKSDTGLPPVPNATNLTRRPVTSYRKKRKQYTDASTVMNLAMDCLPVDSPKKESTTLTPLPTNCFTPNHVTGTGAKKPANSIAGSDKTKKKKKTLHRPTSEPCTTTATRLGQDLKQDLKQDLEQDLIHCPIQLDVPPFRITLTADEAQRLAHTLIIPGGYRGMTEQPPPPPLPWMDKEWASLVLTLLDAQDWVDDDVLQQMIGSVYWVLRVLTRSPWLYAHMVRMEYPLPL
ncbi:hypothetical protein SNE40_014306 [Patella caerulea]|uniref:Uncharacterized protein n=1 Tax=Patella caerulea TaxID=87958 RepID=A0AAN8PQ99_PATCE